MTPARDEQERYKRALADRIADLLRRRNEHSGGMDTGAIRDRLRGRKVEAHPDNMLSISSAVIRAEVEGVPVVAVGNDHPLGTQITGLLDALHFWLERYHGEGPLRYVVGGREDEREMAELTAALGSLRAALSGVDVSVEIDFHAADLPSADFAQAKLEWAELIAKRHALLAEPPELVRQLSSIVDDPSFDWYMSVHAPHYSGRIDGLQICTVARDGASGTLKIGAARGNEGRLVREQFRDASDGRDEVPFYRGDLREPARIIIDLIDRRRHGALAGLKREHRLV